MNVEKLKTLVMGAMLLVMVFMTYQANQIAANVSPDKELTDRIVFLENQVASANSNIGVLGSFVNWSTPILDLRIVKDTLLQGQTDKPYPRWAEVVELIKKQREEAAAKAQGEEPPQPKEAPAQVAPPEQKE